MLPKIKHKIHSTYLEGIKKEVKFRKFIGSDYKILLEAKESKDRNDMVDAVIQVTNNCILDEIDVSTLTFYDLEWLYIQIFIQSSTDISTIIYTYDDKEIKVHIPLDQIKITKSNSNNLIKVDEKISIELKEPTLELMSLSEEAMISKSIHRIYNGDEVEDPNDYKDEEILDFLDELDVSIIMEINKYFKDLPHLYWSTTIKLDEDTDKKLEFIGLNDFFM
jgi:hypothetical protein